jgi:hypothetical protein
MKQATRNANRETTAVPVLTMEEVPVLSDEERADLVASLKQAEAEVAVGRAKPFDREEFKRRFLAICRGEID